MTFIKVVLALLAIVSTAYARDLLQTPAPPPGMPVTPPPLPPSCGTNLPFTDADILIFALNLECLEAEFYSFAAYGKGLDPTVSGNAPPSVGGMKANLSDAVLQVAKEFASDEAGHVTFLRQALGAQAPPCPKVDIGGSFATVANLAFNKTLDPPYSPYANDLNFILASFAFEDVGVTAYDGAAPYIVNRTYLAAAAKILATEGYHGGIARSLIAENLNIATPYYVSVGQISDALSDLRDRLAGGERDQGVLDPPTGGANLVPTDNNGLAFARLPQEVKKIVAPFYPNGLSGGYFATAS